MTDTTAKAHNWIPSTLGHGVLYCPDCCMTVLEASVLGRLNKCGPIIETQQAVTTSDILPSEKFVREMRDIEWW